MAVDLPSTWRLVPLADLADVRSGVAKGRKDLRDPTTLPYLRVANVQDGHLDLTEVKEISIETEHVDRYSLAVGDVLLTEGGDFDKLGRGTVWRGQIARCLHQNHVFAVRCNSSQLSPDFLSALTSSAYGKAYFLGASKQTTNLASINATQLRAFPVLLPPLPEQRKIAAILSAVDEVIEKTEAVIESLQALKKAMMQELLTRGLPGRHTRFKQTEIGEVPEEWEVVSLKCVVDFQPGYAFKSADFAVSGDRLLRGSNVAPGAIDWESDKTKFFPTERRNEVQEYVLRANDIVIGMDRPFVNSGFKIARMTDTDLPALLLQRVGRFVRLAGHLDSEYLWVVARSGFVEGHLRVQQKGTDLPHISRDEILDSVIPLPPPQEQRAIGEVFASIDRRTLSERSALARSMVVKSALMSVLLTGELRVTPDQDVA